MAKGKVTFNEEVCKGCGLCITVCPLKIIEMDEKKINSKGYNPVHVIAPEKCTGCANCAVMCPDVAITVVREEKKENREKGLEKREE